MIRDADPRDILFEGPLLHKVAENLRNPIYIEITRLFHHSKDDSLDYAPMWYWCGLSSLSFKISEHLTPITDEKAKQLKMLYHPELMAPSRTIGRISTAISSFLTHQLSQQELLEIDRMTIIWTLNCFEHADNPLTYASFFLPSFMSHSCGPTGMWTSIGDTFVIRAQRQLGVGDELTVSYLTEEFALRPMERRIEHLKSTKFFTCDCPRCTPRTDDTRGFMMPNGKCFSRFPEFPADHNQTTIIPF
jgi:hypothetical protein